MKDHDIENILNEGTSCNNADFEINMDDVEVESFRFNNGFVEDMELSSEAYVEAIDGESAEEYILFNKGEFKDFLRQLEVDDPKPIDRNVELAALGEVIDSCLQGSTTLYIDGSNLGHMTNNNIASAILSQFKLKLDQMYS